MHNMQAQETISLYIPLSCPGGKNRSSICKSSLTLEILYYNYIFSFFHLLRLAITTTVDKQSTRRLDEIWINPQMPKVFRQSKTPKGG